MATNIFIAIVSICIGFYIGVSATAWMIRERVKEFGVYSFNGLEVRKK